MTTSCDSPPAAAWGTVPSSCRVTAPFGNPRVQLTFQAPADDPAIARLADEIVNEVLLDDLLDALRHSPPVQSLKGLEGEHRAACEEEGRLSRELADARNRRREAVSDPAGHGGGLGAALAAADDEIARLEAERARAAKAVAVLGPPLTSARKDALAEAGRLRQRLGAAALPKMAQRQDKTLARITGLLNETLTELAAAYRANFTLSMGSTWGGQEDTLLRQAGVEGRQPPPERRPEPLPAAAKS